MKHIVKHKNQLQKIADHIMQLNPDNEWIIEVKKHVKRRSNNQNNLMWMWLDKIASLMSDESGYEIWEIHELFKDNFLIGKEVHLGGLQVIVKTTTDLTTSEMTRYLDQIQRFCSAEMGIYLPLPEELQKR